MNTSVRKYLFLLPHCIFFSSVRFTMGAVFALMFFAPILPAATFTVASTNPGSESKKTIGQNQSIAITFEKSLASGWVGNIAIYRNGMPGLYSGVNPLSVPGSWSLTDPQTLTFTPSASYPNGSLLMVKIDPALTATDGSTFDPARISWSFIVTRGLTPHITTQSDFILRTVLQNGISHDIPIRILNPSTSGPHPVMFFVHGGAWTGGTATASVVNDALQAQYLAEQFGITAVSIAYRCLGSGGTFSEGHSDVNFAVNYVRNHAASYNIDINRMGLYGASAGTPLSALCAQQQGVLCYVGFNGIYDFYSNPGSAFPANNNYEWQTPGAKFNSAYYNLAVPPPQTLLMHGSADTTINNQQSVLFGDQIVNSGGQARVIIYTGQTHGFFNPGREMELPALWEMKKFLKDVFGL